MSKNFLTGKEAYTKLLIKDNNSTDFITKSELIATGRADTSLLSQYGSNGFVIDDDIQTQKKVVFEIYDTAFGGESIPPHVDLSGFGIISKNPFRINVAAAFRRNVDMFGFVILDNHANKVFQFSVDEVSGPRSYRIIDHIGNEYICGPFSNSTFTFTYIYNGAQSPPEFTTNRTITEHTEGSGTPPVGYFNIMPIAGDFKGTTGQPSDLRLINLQILI